MNPLNIGKKWLAALALVAALTASVQAATFSFPQNQGSLSDYIQYGPTDSILVTNGPYSPATSLTYIFGPPYRLEITVNTNVAKGQYTVGVINGFENVDVWIY